MRCAVLFGGLLPFSLACGSEQGAGSDSSSQDSSTNDGGPSVGGSSADGSVGGSGTSGAQADGGTDASGGTTVGGAQGSGGSNSQGTGAMSGGGEPSTAGGGDSSAGGEMGAGVPTEEAVPDLPTPRQEHAVAAFQGEVYVLGGFTPDNTATMEVFSPQSNLWRAARAFPIGCHHPNLVGVGDRLYVAGFHLGGDSPLRTGDPRTFAYDPATDEWSPRAEMPAGTGRGAACVTTLGSSIYVFGGSDDPTLSFASVYDTLADSWTALPDLPRPRDHCYAAELGGKIYILAGRNGGITDIEPESWVFDPQSHQYEEISQIPTPRGGVAGGVIDGKIYIFGGEGNSDDPVGIFSEIEVYDPIANQWQSLPDLLTPRHGFGGASIDGRIYLAGGGATQGLAPLATSSVFFLAP